MESTATPRPQTPPHEPKYGVHVASETIDAIIEKGFNGAKLESIEPLLEQSYNNRLYFVKVTRTGEGSLFSDIVQSERELVLKANGRFFGAEKIQMKLGVSV